jgi:hypothetical protein
MVGFEGDSAASEGVSAAFEVVPEALAVEASMVAVVLAAVGTGADIDKLNFFERFLNLNLTPNLNPLNRRD